MLERDSSPLTPSPPSSPSLVPVDSSPPSSPTLHPLSTPTSSPRDPFAGSSKSNRRPPSYELHHRTRSGTAQAGDEGGSPLRFFARPASEHPLEDPIAADATPTRPTRAIDLFSAAAKREWRPPTYEKKTGHVFVGTSTSSTYPPRDPAHLAPLTLPSRAGPLPPDDADDFHLTDDEHEFAKPPPISKTREDIEHDMWEAAIAHVIEQGNNGVIDLSTMKLGRGIISSIPPSIIADLKNRTVLSPSHDPSTAPPPTDISPNPSTSVALAPSTFTPSRPIVRSNTLPSSFDEPFIRSKDGECLRGTPAARAASLQAITHQPKGLPHRRDIAIYLANNAISQLPLELFRLNNLTVLSLRSNKLTSVPPEIARLTALKELSLAQNRLRWLPAEMLSMRLVKLTLSGNPWIPPPPSESPESRHSGPGPNRRPVSDTITHFSVPPLTETCFRVLVAPFNPTPAPPNPPCTPPSSSQQPEQPDAVVPSMIPPQKQQTVLEAAYSLPLTEDLLISPNILATLRTCVPAAVARPAEDQLPPKVRRRNTMRQDVHSAWGAHTHARSRLATRKHEHEHEHEHDTDTDDDADVFAPRRSHQVPVPPAASADADRAAAVSLCPSPAHREGDGTWARARTPVFLRAAEERWTWEEVVAGVRVGAEGGRGGGVPVQWRGCSRGCLAFLDPAPRNPGPGPGEGEGEGEGGDANANAGGGGEGGVSLDLEAEADVDMVSVRFEGGLADPEDFEEPF